MKSSVCPESTPQARPGDRRPQNSSPAPQSWPPLKPLGAWTHWSSCGRTAGSPLRHSVLMDRRGREHLSRLKVRVREAGRRVLLPLPDSEREQRREEAGWRDHISYKNVLHESWRGVYKEMQSPGQPRGQMSLLLLPNSPFLDTGHCPWAFTSCSADPLGPKILSAHP